MDNGELQKLQKLWQWRFGMAIWPFRDTPLAMLSRRQNRQSPVSLLLMPNSPTNLGDGQQRSRARRFAGHHETQSMYLSRQCTRVSNLLVPRYLAIWRFTGLDACSRNCYPACQWHRTIAWIIISGKRIVSPKNVK